MTQIINSSTNRLDRTKPPVSHPPKDVRFPGYFDTTMVNGINLLTIENTKIPVVSVKLIFKNSGSYFDGDKFGLSSLVSELLTKGTKNRTASEIAEEIDFLGASLSSGSDWDGSFITLTVLKKYLDKAIEILADTVTNPIFLEDEISRLKDQRTATLLQSKDDASYLSEKLFDKVVYGSYPYANPLEGTIETISKITRSDIINFYNQKYLSQNIIIAFAGYITKEEAVNFTDKYFVNYRNENNIQSEILSDINYPYPNHDIYLVGKRGAVQSNIKIGHLGIERNNPDFIHVIVMNTLLGGYFGSRINYKLREVHGITYGARSVFNTKLLQGDFMVDADVRNEVTGFAVQLIKEELEKITSEKVKDEELQFVKNYLCGTFPLTLETPNSVISRVINLKLYNLPKNYYNTYVSRINNTSKEDIYNMAKKYIHPDKLYIVISGNTKEIKEQVVKFGKPRIFNSDFDELSD